MPKENRYHCNQCNRSFSVTVGTIFHKTKCDLRKWFLAISLVLNAKKGISARQLARDIEVTKDTGWYMMMRIRKAFVEYGELLEGIIEVDETHIGGKNKNRHQDKKTKGGQGGADKIIVAGLLQRGGEVRAEKIEDKSSKTLHKIIAENVSVGSKIMSDEWRAYNGLSAIYGHEVVRHADGEYTKGSCHINTIEGFWSLLKRGIVGQFHYLSVKYLNKYIDEFCFRYNHRNHSNTFELTLMRGLNL